MIVYIYADSLTDYVYNGSNNMLLKLNQLLFNCQYSVNESIIVIRRLEFQLKKERKKESIFTIAVIEKKIK